MIFFNGLYFLLRILASSSCELACSLICEYAIFFLLFFAILKKYSYMIFTFMSNGMLLKFAALDPTENKYFFSSPDENKVDF